MKRYLLLLLLSTFGMVQQSQAQLLGGYYAFVAMYDMLTSFEEGGLDVKITEMNGELVPLYGGKGGWTLKDEKFLVGLSGYYTRFTFNDEARSTVDFETYYTGVLIEMRHRPEKPFHLNTNLTIGYGFAQNSGWQGDSFDFSQYMVGEPNVTMMATPLPFVRIGVGAGYRYVFGSQLAGASDASLSGPAYNFSLIFGRFSTGRPNNIMSEE